MRKADEDTRNATYQAMRGRFMGLAVAMGISLSIFLFFLLPMVVGSFFDRWIDNMLVLNLLEGLIRILIFMAYMILVSRMGEMKRVFAYHGAEHKTIFCYEKGLELTVENVRKQSRFHPRCGTSFMVLMLITALVITHQITPAVRAIDIG